MKVTSINTQQISSSIGKSTDISKLGNSGETNIPNFQERLEEGLQNVAKAQNSAAQIAKNFELGTENDLAKVMVSQQVSSLAFQLTLNVRNKALSAYKDIMNMPV
tara:strand:- start:536 stop:850 length:315 start_codon:yes stop_codon:yes gene_type:complete